MTEDDLDRYVDAYEDSFPYARDNHGVLTAYANQLIRGCEGMSGIEMCSLGVGYETVSRTIGAELGGRISSYIAIEGSKRLIERYDRDVPFPFELVHGYFERFETNQRFDVIEMGFVLEHVQDPALIVRRFADMLKDGGVICAAVPNARSMHRILGYRAGLLDDVYALTEWDHRLGHRRYFDADSFRQVFENEGLIVRRETGLMLKPFSTAQLDSLELPDRVWEALYLSGDLAPQHAYGLYLEAIRE